MFYQEDLQVYENNHDYADDEHLLIKIIFTSYNAKKMRDHGFGKNKIDDDWKTIDLIKKRKRNL